MPKYRNRKFGLLHFSDCTSDSKLWALLWPMKGESWLYVSFLSRSFKRQCRPQHIFFFHSTILSGTMWLVNASSGWVPERRQHDNEQRT